MAAARAKAMMVARAAARVAARAHARVIVDLNWAAAPRRKRHPQRSIVALQRWSREGPETNRRSAASHTRMHSRPSPLPDLLT